MDQAISKLLFIAASIAVAAGVTGVAWRTLSDNTPDTENPTFDPNNTTNPVLCRATGRTWTDNTKTCS